MIRDDCDIRTQKSFVGAGKGDGGQARVACMATGHG